MREQIRHAQFIVANKVDLLSEMEQGTLAFELQQLNAHAKIYLTNQAKVSMKDIVSMSGKNEKVAYEKSPFGNQLALKAVVYTFKGYVDGEAFENWVKEQPDTIYRMKGYIPFKGRKYPTMFQYSYGMPLFMPGDMKYPTNFVIIGENLQEEEIIHSLEKIDLI